MYVANKSASNYPFKNDVPFPLDAILDIKLALKGNYGTPGVSYIYSADGKLSILFSTGSQWLGTATYTDSLFIPVDSLFLYGFVLLGCVPVSEFKYSGFLLLQQNTYTYPVSTPGLKSVKCNGLYIEDSYILNLSFLGDITMWFLDNTITVGRSTDTFYTFSSLLADTAQYVLTVNGALCTKLEIKTTQDKTIKIENFKGADNNVKILYVASALDFPVCSDCVEE